MKKIVSSIIIFSLLIFCSGWGFLVHRTVTQLAVYQLPKKMQPFFYSHLDSIVKNSVRPDLRRSQDPSEATKHFIDLEFFGDSAAWKMPMQWDEAIKKYPKDSILKYGHVPYWIVEMKNRLTIAFRSANADSILFYATDLCHYIADANVPLHTSINYDGQLTGQRGLHALWESVVPEVELNQYSLYKKHRAMYLDHPEEEIWKGIRRAHLLVKDVFAKEKEVSQQFNDSTKYRVQIRNGREVKYYTSEFAKAYAVALGPTINEQLLLSSNMIADFWYTSWVDAGKPDLSSLLKNGFSRADKRKLKKELKTYKKNQLIPKNILIAKKETFTE